MPSCAQGRLFRPSCVCVCVCVVSEAINTGFMAVRSRVMEGREPSPCVCVCVCVCVFTGKNRREVVGHRPRYLPSDSHGQHHPQEKAVRILPGEGFDPR